MKISTKRKIDALLKRGTRWSSGPIQFFAKAASCSASRPFGGKAGEKSRLGILVPKKLYRKAVDRNRMKRLLRESWRGISVAPNWEILVMMRGTMDLKRAKQKDVEHWLLLGLQKKNLAA